MAWPQGRKVGFEACSEDLVVENVSEDVLESGAGRWNVLEEVFSVSCRVSVLLSGQKVRRRSWNSVQTGQTPRPSAQSFAVPSSVSTCGLLLIFSSSTPTIHCNNQVVSSIHLYAMLIWWPEKATCHVSDLGEHARVGDILE